MPKPRLDEPTAKQFRRLATESHRREQETMRLFKPLPEQIPFFLSHASQRIVRGGNQCTALNTPIPTNRGLLKAADVQVGDMVVGGVVEKRWISPEPVMTYKIDCEGGFFVVGNAEHPLLTPDGFKKISTIKVGDKIKLALNEWVGTQSCMSPDDGYFAGLMIGDGCITHRYGVMSFTSIDEELHQWLANYLPVETYREKKIIEIRFSSSAIKEKMEHLWGTCITLSKTKRVPTEVFKDKNVAREFLRGYTDTDGCVYCGKTRKTRQVIWISASEWLLRDVQQLLLGFGVYATLYRKDKELDGKMFEQWRLRARGPWADIFMRDVGCKLERKQRKYIYPPADNLPTEKWVKVRGKPYCHKKYVVGLTISPTNTYVTGGLWSHNSGKSVSCAIETACAAIGIPVPGLGRPSRPYPKRGLTIWVIGFNQSHIARIHEFLFEPGLFQLIKDKKTRLMRTWRPWEPEDAAREIETEPSQPLIPKRCIDGEIAYENKGERVFSICRLKNGTTIQAFSSSGKAAQGKAVDLIWIDEDIEYPKHVSEWQARLSKVRGRLIWSAWPHSANPALTKMSRRAEKEAQLEHPDVSEIVLRFSDNPYMPEDEKRKRLKDWADAGESVLRSRDLGEFLTGDSLVYPKFNIDLHGVPCRQRPNDQLDKALAKTNYRIPDDWTCYLGIDPGHTHSAVSFVAIPPPEVGDYFVIYDEIYMQRGTAADMAAEVRKKIGNRRFHAFVFDMQAGRQSLIGLGKTIVRQYAEAFENEGIRSRLTDSGFMPGCNNPGARNMAVRRMMEPRQSGTTKFRIFKDTTPYHQHELELYSKKVTRDDISEDVNKKDDHLMDAMAYVAASEPEYYMRPPEERSKSSAWLAIQKLRGSKKKSDTIFLGAGAAPANPLH